MDVLFDLSPLETMSRYRGIGYYASSLARGLAELTPQQRCNLDIRALISVEDPSPIGGLADIGVSKHLYGGTDWPWYAKRRIHLVRTLLKEKPRLFHATQSMGTPWAAPTPRVVTCHDLIRLVLHREYLAGRAVFRRVLFTAELARFHSARRVIAISQFTADDLMRVLSVPARKIDVVPNGVDHEIFHPPSNELEAHAHRETRKRLGLGQTPYFVFVGGVDPRKQVPMLIHALAQARLDGVQLVLVGRRSPEEQLELPKIAASFGISDRLRMVGHLSSEDMVAVMCGALAMTYPSRYEGFGLPVIEAMACGVPVVTTSATSLAEVGGDAVITVGQSDLPALSRALAGLATDSVLRDQLGKSGLARAQQYSWRICAQQTAHVYCRALGE